MQQKRQKALKLPIPFDDALGALLQTPPPPEARAKKLDARKRMKAKQKAVKR